jgi:hypothetical protein
MVSAVDRVRELQERCDALKAQLAQIGDFRPGSLVERYRRCGKANCHCAQPGARGHGPSWSLTRQVRGKTMTRVIPAGAVERTRRQLNEHRRFRELMRELVETNERLCEAIMADPEAASQEEAAKKGGSVKPSPRKSSRKSRR